jgi:pantetheine-phosphate adenylyltransferase
LKKAIFAASFDTIHYGHINLIERALNVFDHLIVAVGSNPKKTYTFSQEERIAQVQKVLSRFASRVTVNSYPGLLADFAYENEVKTIIRGARNSNDFDFERMLSDINMGFKQELDTYILVADQKLSHISSSAVKELQLNHASNLTEYVPLVIKQALEERISGQYLLGVTGGIGSGKSFVSKSILNLLPKNSKENLVFHHIDMDEIGRYILKESNEPVHRTVRSTIASTLNITTSANDLSAKDDKIDINLLIQLMFDDYDAESARAEFDRIMFEPMMHMVRKKIIGLKGIILLNSALFVEAKICNFVNNNFVLVKCSDETRMTRLKKRNYTDKQIENRLKAQLSTEEKAKAIQDLIKEHSCGSLIEFTNEDKSQCNLLRDAILNVFMGIYGETKHVMIDPYSIEPSLVLAD